MPSEPVFVNETRVQTLLDCTLKGIAASNPL